MAKIDNLFHLLHANHGSDLHLSAGNPPLLRIYGDLARVDAPVVTTEELLAVLREMVPMERVQAFEQTGDLDFAYDIPGLARYRANFFRQNRGISAVFREIPQRISTVEELGLPIMLRELALLPKGLVLVTGPTGSGKSTTLAALVDYANTKRRDHIITIEDPIEFVHQSKSCLVNQREIGRDSRSFGTALRSALREDPDIILVGEMRDLETISLALEAAETGHLVFATLHTISAPKTIDRIIEVFRMLPIIDPNREFALEARSLRQNILETILESEATNKQIYDLYHVQDDSNRDYYARYEDGWNDETTDYFGRSVHTHASVNDGFDTFGYDHRRHVEADDAALKPFLIGEMPAETMEGVRAVDFYKYMPAALTENYNNYAWYEIPLMKEWLVKKDEEPKGVPAVDWNAMRDATGALKVPASAVFDEKHNLKVSLSDLGALREALAGEYEMMPRELKEGLEDREGVMEMKTQDQLVKEIRKNWGDAYSEWNDVSTEIHFPSDKEDFATSYLMNDALVRFSNGEEGEEESEEEPRKKAW